MAIRSRLRRAIFVCLAILLLGQNTMVLALPAEGNRVHKQQPIIQEIIPDWAADSIRALQEAGVISNYPDGTVKPERAVTRAELLMFVHRMRQFDESAAANSSDANISFSDVSDEWFAEAVYVAAREGIVNGYPDGSFRPNNPITRQEAAVILAQAFQPSRSEASYRFADHDQIPSWAQEAVYALAENGWLQGFEDGTFLGMKMMTRAESAVVLQRIWKARVEKRTDEEEHTTDISISVHNEDDQPVSSSIVRVHRVGEKAPLYWERSNVDGQMTLSLEPGRYDIIAQTSDLVAHRTINVDDEVQSYRLKARPSTKITGKIVDVDGQAAAHMLLSLQTNPVFFTFTKSDGSFVIELPAEQTYDLSVLDLLTWRSMHDDDQTLDDAVMHHPEIFEAFSWWDASDEKMSTCTCNRWEALLTFDSPEQGQTKELGTIRLDDEIKGSRQSGNTGGGGSVTPPEGGGEDAEDPDPEESDEEYLVPPTGLRTEAGDGQVTLSWHVGNDAGTVTGYKVYHAAVGSDWHGIDDVGFRDSFTIDNLVNGQSYQFAVSAYDDQGRESSRSDLLLATPQSVTDPELPPDPVKLAPSLSRSGTTPFIEMIDFIYSGEQPIQTGVEPGTIRAEHAAVLRGKVTDADGAPLSGVTITILHHDEFGHTETRDDGHFDMVVNGNALWTVDYVKQGYLPVQRKVSTPATDYAVLPDVVMLPLDEQVTEVKFGTEVASYQSAQGSRMTDEAGSRQATLIIPSQTSAKLVMADGSEQEMGSLQIRATEYTVGDRGEAAMPGELPAFVGYTYAVELSADEAIADGASEVRFDRPLYLYVDNYLQFPVGEVVPIGYYDRQLGRWVPSDNGRVVQVVDVQDGVVTIDIDGDGIADDDVALSELGITIDERKELALLYEPGESFWRSPIEHFTPWDCNWPYGPPEDAEPPPDRPPNEYEPEIEDPCIQSGSIIGCQDQSLKQHIPITGTGLELVYDSRRAQGYIGSGKLEIPLTGDNLPSKLQEIEVKIRIAGRQIVKTFEPETNLSYNFIWDGKDAYGRDIYGNVSYTVNIIYYYPIVYYASQDSFQQSFGRLSRNSTVIGERGSTKIGLQRSWNGLLATKVNPYEQSGVAGWSFNIHHSKPGSELRYGYGETRQLASLYYDEMFPTREFEYAPQPDELVVGPDGKVYVTLPHIASEKMTSDILVIDRNGERQTIETPARGINIMRVSPAGDLYITGYTPPDDDRHQNIMIWKKARESTEWVEVAGEGDVSFRDIQTGDHLSSLKLDNHLIQFAVDRFDNLYLLVSSSIFKVDEWGWIERLSEYSSEGYTEGPATPGRIGNNRYFQIGQDGSIYLLDIGDHSHYRDRLRKITPDGQVKILWHRIPYDQESEPIYDGAHVSDPIMFLIGYSRFEIDMYDNLYFIASVPGSTYSHLYMLTPQGRFRLIKENIKRNDYQGNYLGHIADVSSDGYIYYTYNKDLKFQYRRITGAGFTAGTELIADEGGRFAYEFDSQTGRHLRTLDAVTGMVIYTFEYDDAGRLLTLSDRNGNTVTIERDENGTPLSIISPFGQRTLLEVDEEGQLIQVVNPTGESYEMAYNEQQLLTTYTDPQSEQRSYDYDEGGLLIRAVQPDGTEKTLSREKLDNGYEVKVTEAERRTTVYRVENLDDHIKRERVDPSGAVTTSFNYTNGVTEVRYPDGTVIISRQAPDPVWRMQSPVIDELIIRSPDGRESVYRENREAIGYIPGEPFSGEGWKVTYSWNDAISTVYYNRETRTYTETSAEGRQVITRMNDRDYTEEIYHPGLDQASLRYTYDDHGRILRIEQGDQFVEHTYDELGRLITTQDATGSVKSFEYDAANRLVSVQQPSGSVYTQGYDPAGNRVELGLPNLDSYQMDYTKRNALAEFTPQGIEGGLIRSYDEWGDLRSATTSEGRVINYTYDDGGRILGISDHDVSHSFIYADNTDRVTTAISNLNSQEHRLDYTYNGMDISSMRSSGMADVWWQYTYDEASRLSSMMMTVRADVYGHTIETEHIAPLSWDRDGLLTGYGSFNFVRDSFDGKVMTEEDDRFSVDRLYDELGRVNTITYHLNGVEIYRETMQYDPRGWITAKQVSTSGKVETYHYIHDLDGQLTEVRVTNSEGIVRTEQYAYDDNRNRISRTIDQDMPDMATYGSHNRLLQVGEVSYSFDGDGFLQARGKDQFRYGSRGELLEAVIDGEKISYGYDYTGRRVSRTTMNHMTEYLYGNPLDPYMLTASIDHAGVLTFYEYDEDGLLLAFERNGDRYYVITDAVGTPQSIWNAHGVMVKQLQYDSFGVLQHDSNPDLQLDIGFAGGLADTKTLLVRFGQRDYDPASGRWTALDPILFEGGQANLYVYVNNSPIMMRDPCGLFCIGASLYSGIGGGAQVCITSDGMSVCGELGIGLGGGVEVSPFGDLAPNHASVSASLAVKKGPLGLEIGGELSNLDDCNYGVSPILNLNTGPLSMDLTNPANSSVGGHHDELGRSASDLWRDSMRDLGAKAQMALKGKICGGMTW